MRRGDGRCHLAALGLDLGKVGLEALLVRLDCVVHGHLDQCQVGLADWPRASGGNCGGGDLIPVGHDIRVSNRPWNECEAQRNCCNASSLDHGRSSSLVPVRWLVVG